MRAYVVGLALALVPGLAAAQAPFTAAVSPQPVTLQAGGGAVAVTVTTTPGPDFREPVRYTFSGFPAGIATGQPQTVEPPYQPVVFQFSAGGSVGPGTYSGLLTGQASAATVTVPVTVIVQRPDFSLAANPGSITLEPGESRTVTVAVVGSGGFSGSVDVATGAQGAVAAQPATFALGSGASRGVVITAGASAQPGAASVTFTGTASGITGPRTAQVGVTIVAPAPVVEAITPPDLATGTRENTLRIIGRHFQQGATVTSADAAVQVLRARVLSSTLAEVVVVVRADAPAGRYRLDVRNPDGRVAGGGAMLRVSAAASASAPLAVTAVRILSPRPWQVVAEGESMHAVALLATTGMGTVVGSWHVDGVPFERFTHVVSGGRPVEIRSRLPIPSTSLGEHRLELVLDAPLTLPTEGVPFLQATERRSALRLLSPIPGQPVDPVTPSFRWTLVPGASGYEVEVRYRARDAADDAPWRTVRRRVNTTEWRPERALRDALRESDAAIRVRALQPGDVPGEASDWSVIRFDAEPPARDGPQGMGMIGPAAAPLGAGDPWYASVVDPLVAFDPAVAERDGAVPTRQLDLSVAGTTTARRSNPSGPDGLTRLLLSGQADVNEGWLRSQATGDVSVSHDVGDPWNGRGENRNWVARFGADAGFVKPDLTVGFSPPSFLDRTELLAVFTGGGGVQGTVESVAGRMSYFQSARLAASDVHGGGEPRVSAGAWEYATDDGRYLVRGTTLHVRDAGIDDFSPATSGTAYGVLVAAHVGRRLQVIGEGAFGEHRPDEEEGFLEERDGMAFRVAAQGDAGSMGYRLALSRAEEGFVNPANPGFTPSGVSGRTRAELTLSNLFYGETMLTGTFSHVRGGVAHGAGDARGTETGANLGVSVPVSPRVALTVGGNVHNQRGAAVEEFDLAATDRTRRGVEVMVSETLGPLSLSQSLAFHDLVGGDEWADQRVLDAAFSAHGTVHRLLTVHASLSESRMSGAAALGTTRQRLFAVQPALTVWHSRLRIASRAAFSHAHNPTLLHDQRSLNYQLTTRWTAPWTRIPLTAELTTDWGRNWSTHDVDRPGFLRRTLFTLGMNWRADRAW